MKQMLSAEVPSMSPMAVTKGIATCITAPSCDERDNIQKIRSMKSVHETQAKTNIVGVQLMPPHIVNDEPRKK